MAKKNYYAVRRGRRPGIYRTWEECKSYVTGYPNAEFKGFVTWEEASGYMGIDTYESEDAMERQDAVGNRRNASANPAADSDDGRSIEDHTVIAYVDGSYDHRLQRYSYGCILFLPDGTEVRDSACGNDPELLPFRNVTGEVQGAMHAVEWCMEHGYSSVIIYHDYQGIASWAMKDWKANTSLTQEYTAYMQSAMSKMEIRFQKVAAHTGDTYNEEVDRLAKAALQDEND